MNKNIDIQILWFIEHNARELSVAVITKLLYEKNFGGEVVILNIYENTASALSKYNPKVVIHPFLYKVNQEKATNEILFRWPTAVHINMAWEQIHYPAHLKIKAPADEIASNGVIHFAWGKFFVDYLISNNANEENILITGHPAYSLYKESYRISKENKYEFAKKYNLDPKKKWLFIPENYRWAFSQHRIDMLVEKGGNRSELIELVLWSQQSLKLLLGSLQNFASINSDKYEIILRPRPANNTSIFTSFVYDSINDEPKFRIIKDGSVKDWIVVSDVVVSSYSTTLLEASSISKPIFMYVPIPIPSSLICEWYSSVLQIENIAQVQNISTDSQLEGASWAKNNLIHRWDTLPIIALILNKCVNFSNPKILQPIPRFIGCRIFLEKKEHEKDSLDNKTLSTEINKWVNIVNEIDLKGAANAYLGAGQFDKLTPESFQERSKLTLKTRRPKSVSITEICRYLFFRMKQIFHNRRF